MQRVNRLRASADFERVRAQKRSWAHHLLVLYAAPNELDRPRVGIVVRRLVGKAVVRNLVRRRIREAVRLRLPDLGPPNAAGDLLFVARAPSATADWRKLRGAVDELLRRAHRPSSPPAQPEGSTS